MECPVCEEPMTHLGYFNWACDDCGHRCEGDLPRVPRTDEEGAA